MINAIIVEDQENGMQTLISKLKRNCPFVDIVATCKTGEEAVKTISQLKPHLVFMDIDLGSMTGFEVLEELGNIEFEVIFITAYDQHAIKAFRFNALDYLLKPIDETELMQAVNKALKKIMDRVKPYQRLAVPISNGLRFIDHEDIMYCEADNNMTNIHFYYHKKPLLICRVLRKVEEQLPTDQFMRVYRSSLVNLNAIECLITEDGGYVELVNGTKLRINKKAKEALKKMGI